MKRLGILGTVVLLLCASSCSTRRQTQYGAEPTISAEALYALVPASEPATPPVRLSPTAEATRRQRDEDQQLTTFSDSILALAYRYIGTPYSYGALGPKAFDCSGYVRYVFGRFGYDLPHSSYEMAQVGRPVQSSVGQYSQLKKGDILIFGSRRNSGSIGHVGIFIAADSNGRDGTFIHAAVHGGVIVSQLSEEYYTTRYLGARRIL